LKKHVIRRIENMYDLEEKEKSILSNKELSVKKLNRSFFSNKKQIDEGMNRQ
jgi:hypothetical protein